MTATSNLNVERAIDRDLIHTRAPAGAPVKKSLTTTPTVSAPSGFTAYLGSLMEAVTEAVFGALESFGHYFSWHGKDEPLPPEWAEVELIPEFIEELEKESDLSGDVLLEVPELFPKESAQIEDPLELSSAETVLGYSNLTQWGLIGMGLFGVPPVITIPLNVLSSLGLEVASFCSLPKDASWLRKAMSFPFLAKAILNYNPWVARFFQATSLFNLAQSAGSKIKTAWELRANDPWKAFKAGFVNLFNLVSGVTFAAESVGLFKFPSARAQESEDTLIKKSCTPKRDAGCQGPINRKVRISAAYSNRGPEGQQRQLISDLTSQMRQKYADKWGAEHVESTTSLVEEECFNPITLGQETCTPQWNKIKFLHNWCNAPSNSNEEEITVLMDDDAVITNFQIDPSHAFDQLRCGVDSSLIIATEGEGTRANPGAVNTGVMLLRKDGRGCEVMRRVWENRNTVHSLSDANCPTFGLCKGGNFGPTQAALDKVLWQDAPYLDKTVVTRVLSRDATHPHRANIAFNTLNRGGCFTALRKDGKLTWPYNIDRHDLRVNPQGRWQEGDWIGQTGGYPLYGQDLSHSKTCENDPRVPIEMIRLKKVRQMLDAADRSLEREPRVLREVLPHHVKTQNSEAQKLFIPPLSRPFLKRKVLFGAVYDNSEDSNRESISDFVNKNHKEYAERHGMEHTVVAGNLVKGQCNSDPKDEPVDCAPYWNKIARIRDWLHEPQSFDGEVWYIYGDDDMLVMNMKINPSKAIDQLRGRHDTSFIIARDVIDWQKWFFEESDPSLSINTGIMMIRKDARARALFDAIWELRHHPVVSPSAECTNIGNCRLQEKSMQEQEALTILLRNNKHLIDDVVTIVSPRDTKSSTRAHLAMNTFYRGGCLVKKNRAGKSEAFSYDAMDQAVNPEGAFRKGDWLTQAAGVPVWGKDIPHSSGTCADDPNIPYVPLRFNKLKELAQHVVR